MSRLEATRWIEDRILLFCPGCKRERLVVRRADDPRDAAFLDLHCPECVEGGFDASVYRDLDRRPLRPCTASDCSDDPSADPDRDPPTRASRPAGGA